MKGNIVCIVGVGLIGGSIGLNLVHKKTPGRVIGVGHRQISIDKAIASGAIHEGTLDPVQGVRNADVIILCTSITLIPKLTKTIMPHLTPGAIITDVGSTKEWLIDQITPILREDIHFVPAHPIAGSEKRGIDYAEEHLFENSTCVVTPLENNSAEAVEFIEGFWRELGAHVLTMKPAEHDRILGFVSHLTHFTSAALAKSVPQDYLPLAGTGFKDTTRVASGDPGIWIDVIQTNRNNILKALAVLKENIHELEDLLVKEDYEGVFNFLEKAKSNRDVVK